MIGGLPLMRNVLTPLPKSVLISLRLATPLTISNKEIKDIMKIVKSLEESRLLIKRISETIKNERKEQEGGLAGEGIIRAGQNV